MKFGYKKGTHNQEFLASVTIPFTTWLETGGTITVTNVTRNQRPLGILRISCDIQTTCLENACQDAPFYPGRFLIVSCVGSNVSMPKKTHKNYGQNQAVKLRM